MNKKAIITGGDSGIGSGMAACFAKAGFDIAITSIELDEKAHKIEKELTEKYGINFYKYNMDLAQKDALPRIIEKAYEDLGGLDVMVNNAILPLGKNELMDLQDENIDHMVYGNLRSLIVGMRTAAKIFIKNKTRGVILNTSSVRGEGAFVEDGLYCGLKAAINQLSRTFALELGQYGIRVNCIEPGYIRVRSDEQLRAAGADEAEIRRWLREGEKVPLGRYGLPEDVGNLATFLVSDKAEYISGVCLPIDGALSVAGQPIEFEYEEGVEEFGWNVGAKMETKGWGLKKNRNHPELMQ